MFFIANNLFGTGFKNSSRKLEAIHLTVLNFDEHTE